MFDFLLAFLADFTLSSLSTAHLGVVTLINLHLYFCPRLRSFSIMFVTPQVFEFEPFYS